MPLVDEIVTLHPEMTAWRRALHAMPETAFEEHRTAAFVAEKLASFGIPFEQGLAGTGIIATLHGRESGPSIGLRADMDALDIQEATNLPYRSTVPGKMHACGHDGHMAMLLGAAQHLAKTRNFAGTVHFIFQPAEEMAGGGKVMVEQGLFEKFPMSQVFGLHNWPGQAFGTFSGKPGPMLAASDVFEVTITGTGAHGAMPHLGIDPVLVAAEIISSLQSITSRSVDPNESAVVSVTQIHGGDAWNIIPGEVVLRGTVRTFRPHVRARVEERLRAITHGICAAHGAEGKVWYDYRYPATVNTAGETALAQAAAGDAVGADNVIPDPASSMASEDFAYMLEARPGAYLWLGSGAGIGLHNAGYDFNDALLPIGASYWVRLTERVLGMSAGERRINF
ncbi:M20 aminoacylase family protein [Ancylobacter sp. SL191]|uniref:M20 aminoacylase family protein n=1 Tax=Ancylobacter sp. SL191 TaxID=2995166 RepID=UPI00226D980E|nr:M20 aminoacylase family protein [Ancylobacter sp. SL191]WAC27702.1 M20 family metallopeptidase [Ancylobacter sp. SL191]